MKTIVTTVTADELTDIKNGKNFILHRTKVKPEVGQPLILQTPDDEYATKVELVQDGPGIFSSYYILAWRVWNVPPVVDMTAGDPIIKVNIAAFDEQGG